MSILKKVITAAVGSIASFYAVKWVTAALEKRPLKTRVKDLKGRMRSARSDLLEKASELKTDLQTRSDEAKLKAKEKLADLIEEKKQN